MPCRYTGNYIYSITSSLSLLLLLLLFLLLPFLLLLENILLGKQVLSYQVCRLSVREKVLFHHCTLPTSSRAHLSDQLSSNVITLHLVTKLLNKQLPLLFHLLHLRLGEAKETKIIANEIRRETHREVKIERYLLSLTKSCFHLSLSTSWAGAGR